MINFQAAAIIALNAIMANCLKVGIISDLHVNQAYHIDGNKDDNCTSSAAAYTTIWAPLGRDKCDPPAILVDHMLTRFTEKFGQVDVVLVLGDQAAHKIAPKYG